MSFHAVVLYIIPAGTHVPYVNMVGESVRQFEAYLNVKRNFRELICIFMQTGVFSDSKLSKAKQGMRPPSCIIRPLCVTNQTFVLLNLLITWMQVWPCFSYFFYLSAQTVPK